MRPLGEMDARGVEGVVFDVDDTVTREGIVEREAFDALWALRDAGLTTIACTGRPLGWTDAIAGTWPVSAAVGENGAGWALRRGHVLELGTFDEPGRDAARRAQLEAIRAEVAARMPEVRLARDQPARRADLAFDVAETAHLGPAQLDALGAILAAHGARMLISTVHAHAIVGAWDKAQGAVRAAEALGIPPARARAALVFVGDSGNDAAAFSFFARTVGVANVAPHVPKLPDPPRWVTPSDRGRGFAELAAHLLEARR